MTSASTPRTAPRQTLAHSVRRLASRLALLALLAFIIFEVGIRLIPPNAVQITSSAWGVSGYGPTGVGPTITRTVTDPSAVAYARAAITADPTSETSLDPFAGICNGGFGEGVTYRFTWHGIPVETASSHSSNCGDWVLLAVSSGGLTDPFLYSVEPPPLVPPLN